MRKFIEWLISKYLPGYHLHKSLGRKSRKKNVKRVRKPKAVAEVYPTQPE